MISFNKNIKKRLIIIISLTALYFGIIFIDVIVKNLFFENMNGDKGATKITLRHFAQPEENIFLHPGQFKQFLDKIVQGKDGILSWKPFYLILIILYIGLTALIFIVITK